MIALKPSEFYLVLENYDSTNPPQGILITSGEAGSFVSKNYWEFDSTSKSISKKTAKSGDGVLSYFIPWSSLPDYTDSTKSQVSIQSGKTTITKKYLIIPNKDIEAARVYISKTALTSGKSPWDSWQVNSSDEIPPFVADNAHLTSAAIVDKVEFTYLSQALTINTTTVDFLSIPMTVEASFDVDTAWGSLRGPMGFTSDLQTVSKAFTSLGTNGNVDWSNLNVSNGGKVSRILSPFRHLDTSPSDASGWNTYFDDYLDGLSTVYATGIQYPIVDSFHGSDYYIGKVTVSGGKWVVNACDKSGTVKKTVFFTIDPSTFKGNSKDIFAVVESNVGARDILAGINRGIAHINDTILGWAQIFNSYYPTKTATVTGQWIPSDWTNSASYYPSGTLSSGQAIAANQYSNLLHQQSILGSGSNATAVPFPTAVNAQNYCYGFSVDDIWTHGSAVYGQGATGGVGTTKTATIGIFEQG